MSHTTTITGVPLKDPSAIRSAVASLRAERNVNCELRENEDPRAYYANQIKGCEFTIRLNDSRYDVGLKLDSKTGNYALQYDTWGGDVKKQLAVKGIQKPKGMQDSQWGVSAFYQEYAKHAAINAAVSQGFMVEECTIDHEMTVNLVLSD